MIVYVGINTDIIIGDYVTITHSNRQPHIQAQAELVHANSQKMPQCIMSDSGVGALVLGVLKPHLAFSQEDYINILGRVMETCMTILIINCSSLQHMMCY